MIGADKSSSQKEPPKVLSTNPADCTVTLENLFEANEQRYKGTGILRSINIMPQIELDQLAGEEGGRGVSTPC